MSILRLRNLISLRTRDISKRLRRCLENLHEQLARESKPELQPIPVPVRNNGKRTIGNSFRRFYSSSCGFNSGDMWRFHLKHKKCNFNSFNFFKFYHNTQNAHSKIFRALNKGFLFNNFSQAHQSAYRLKLIQNNVKLTYRALFNFPCLNDTQAKKKFGNKFKPSIRLNLSLSPTHHSLTLKMARTDSTASYEEKVSSGQVLHGCYIEFPVNLNFNIPSETILNDDIFNELIGDLNVLQKKIEELKKDLSHLFELGELPIKYVASRNVIRVYFPNCDKSKLESLCREKSIQGGIIYEDFEGMEETTLSESIASSVVSQDDILSFYSNSNASISSFNSSDEDLLSDSLLSPLSDSDIVRIEEPNLFNDFDVREISINESAEYY